MKFLQSRYNIVRALICSAAVLVAVTAQAQVSYRISLNTAPLLGSSAGPFYADFQFVDGSGGGDANNQAWIGNFQFGGGSPSGVAAGMGSFSGSLGSSVSLTDGSFFNEFYQAFTPGSTLQFDLTLTTRADAGSTPDSFAFAILDSTLSNLPTLAPGSDVFLQIDLGATPIVRTYAGNANMPPAAGGLPIAIAAAVVTPVPEASTYGLWALVTLFAAALWRRRQRSEH